MNRIKLRLLPWIGCALIASGAVIADDDDDHMLEITRIEVELGDQMAFREGVKAYMECYAENDGEGSWSAWSNVDGEGSQYHIVSELDGWADLDEDDEAGMACWPVVEEKIAPHMESVHTMFARKLGAWSGDAEGFTVVRLHNFRVSDDAGFRAAVGSITQMVKIAEYEHLGTWYDVLGGGTDDPEYFVVEHFKNFADMDAERAGVYKTVVEHAGEESADILWEKFRSSLEAEEEYWSELLRYEAELSHSNDDD